MSQRYLDVNSENGTIRRIPFPTISPQSEAGVICRQFPAIAGIFMLHGILLWRSRCVARG